MVSNIVLHKICRRILKHKGVRFCGIINHMGRQVAGGYKEGISPLVDEDGHKMCMEYALEMSMTRDLDGFLGPTRHIVSRRTLVTIITIPINNHLVLISAEPNSDETRIIKEATTLFEQKLDEAKQKAALIS